MKQLPSNFDWERVADTREAARRVRDHLESTWMDSRLGVPLGKLLAKAGWVVGSHCWMPMLDIAPDRAADVDLVFVTDVSRDAAAAALKATGMFDTTVNKFGSERFVYRGSAVVAADLWTLPQGVSIVEHVLEFSQRHEHCAFAVGLPVDLALTRLTHVHYVADDFSKQTKKPAAY